MSAIYNLYIILLELCIATRKSPESLFGQEAVAKQRSALGQCVCHPASEQDPKVLNRKFAEHESRLLDIKDNNDHGSR
jgi:hypothetical protein